eukprot:TRINITY_DN10974_c0_g1_i2.p1 TRINITY_DN10974_c0_g1~~TRINITY_DN10974_c0_g1_i2.p1  ORF type:complete len:962 (+),score=189.86 TRINITY_DN10974_c0_g1_i2:73-2886(+)
MGSLSIPHAQSNSYAVPPAQSPKAALGSTALSGSPRSLPSSPTASAVQSPSHPASVDIAVPRLMANRSTGDPNSPDASMSSTPTMILPTSAAAPSSPRRRASPGLARPPLENRWMQRVEAACAQASAWDAASSRATHAKRRPGSTFGSSRRGPSDRPAPQPGAAGRTARPREADSGMSRSSSHGVLSKTSQKAEAARKVALLKQAQENCDDMEEEVLAMMSALQRTKEVPKSWAQARAPSPSKTEGCCQGSRRAQSPGHRYASPPPREPGLRTAERALARVNSSSALAGGEGKGQQAHRSRAQAARSAGVDSSWNSSLSARARNAPVASQLRARTGATYPATKAPPTRPLPAGRSTDPDVSDVIRPPPQASHLHEHNQKLVDELTEARNALELQMHQAMSAREERDKGLHRSEALEAFVTKLQTQLSEASERAHYLEERISSVQREMQHQQQQPQPLPEGLDSQAVSGPDEAGGDGSSYRTTNGSANQDPAPLSSVDKASLQGAMVEENEEEGSAEPDDCEEKNQERESAVDDNAEAAEAQPALAHREVSVGQLQAPERQQSESTLMQQQKSRKHADQEPANESDPWEFVVQGQLPDDESCDTARKLVMRYPSNAMQRVADCGIACVCARGHRIDASVPNQDDFLLAMCSWGSQGRVALYGVFDGHGTAGHRCADMARGFLPVHIFGHDEVTKEPEKVLRQAFREAQEEMLRRDPAETLNSGTTATICLVLSRGPTDDNEPEGQIHVYTAHVGDSRAILATRGDDDGGSGSTSAFSVKNLTKDHRPDDEDEADRIKQAGGEVRPHGAGKRARVISPQCGHPGFALTRSLGLASGLECGIISEPEVSSCCVSADSEALLVLGTDGLFEFCSGRTVAGHLLMKGITEAALEEVVQESRKLWSVNSSNCTVDDATAIAVSLSGSRPPRRLTADLPDDVVQ